MKEQPSDFGQVADIGRYGSAQSVFGEIQPCQPGESSDFRRYRPGQPVAAEVQLRQVSQVADFGWYRAAQSVFRRDSALSAGRVVRFPAVSSRSASCCGGPAAVRLARLPSSGGIVPLSWLLLRDSLLTRPVSSVVTPYQECNGLSLSQFWCWSSWGRGGLVQRYECGAVRRGRA